PARGVSLMGGDAELLEAADISPPRTRLDAIRRALGHRSLLAGLTICVIVLLCVVLGPLLVGADPNAQDPLASFAPPSAEHLMGADSFGRDLLARVLFGGRTTILASISVVFIGGIVGSTLGLAAGYFGGAFGFLVMRLIDLLL